MRRRNTLCFALPALMLLAACGGEGGGGGSSEGSAESLRIGILVNTAGNLVQPSEEAQVGYDMAAAAAPDFLDGREVELVEVETDGTPAGTAAAATQLVQQEGVDFVTGITSTPQALAVGPVVTRLGGVFVDHTAQGNQLTGTDCQTGYYRAAASAAVYSEIVGAALESSPATSWSIIVADYAFGNDMAAGVEAQVTDAGGTIDEIIKTPLGNADFGSAVSQLAGAGSEGLFVALPGSDASTFLKQAGQFGILGDYQHVIGDGLLTNLAPEDFTAVAEQMPENTVEVALSYYPLELESEASAAYLDRFEAEYPGEDFVEIARKASSAWNAIQVIMEAVSEAGSDDPDDVRAALDGLTVELPQGSATMRGDDHQLLVPGAIGRLVNEDGTWRLAQDQYLEADQVTPEPDPACSL